MAAMFIGIVVMLVGSYMIATRNTGDQEGVAKKKNIPSLDGSSASGAQGDELGVLSDILGGTSEDAEGNVTKMIARATFEQMKALDQQGKSPFDEANTDSIEVRNAVERSIDESMSGLFDSAFVGSKEIRIISNNTRDAKRRYLSDLEAALARHPAGESLKNIPGGVQGLVEQACAGENAGIAKEAAENYTATAKDVITIQVPSQWVEFHTSMIVHYRKGDIIFGSFANCVADPIKGFTAAQELSKFIANSSVLQKSLQKMYTEAGL